MTMRRTFLPLVLFAILQLAPHGAAAQSASGSNEDMDAVLRSYFKADEPGAVALVALDGQVIWSGTVGLADMRSKTRSDTGDVFRIGSITKQFTATAIMQLVEEGAVRLDADIREYIDFPKTEQIITVEHLLTHTSGIPNYTDLPTFTPKVFGKDVTVKEVVATFKDLPLAFVPGSRFEYSNSGYILLGLIVEKASGLSWEAYMQEFIFTPAGMMHTSASADNALVAGEVTGYASEKDKWTEATPLSLTWPYSAGVIRSSVGDLNRWNTAVMSGALVPPVSMERAFRPCRLADGSSTGYGYGWSTGKVQGTATLEHGGSINGFQSMGLFDPQDAVYVAVLSNKQDAELDAPAAELMAIAIGAPYPSKPYGVDTAALRSLTGVYVSDKGVERYLTVENGKLWSQRQGSGKRELLCVGQDQFRFVGDVKILEFRRSAGKVTGAVLRSRREDEPMTRTDRPLPVPPKEITVEAATLKSYAGVYELQPGFNLTFRSEGTRLFAQATGQEEFEAFASGPTTFFLKVVDARMEFYPETDSSVKRMKLFQGGAELEGKRIK
jgi:CubicO group peptidase (beta-lactamase class C family)